MAVEYLDLPPAMQREYLHRLDFVGAHALREGLIEYYRFKQRREGA